MNIACSRRSFLRCHVPLSNIHQPHQCLCFHSAQATVLEQSLITGTKSSSSCNNPMQQTNAPTQQTNKLMHIAQSKQINAKSNQTKQKHTCLAYVQCTTQCNYFHMKERTQQDWVLPTSLDVLVVVIFGTNRSLSIPVLHQFTLRKKASFHQVRASLAARSPTNSPHLAPYFIRWHRDLFPININFLNLSQDYEQHRMQDSTSKQYRSESQHHYFSFS